MALKSPQTLWMNVMGFSALIEFFGFGFGLTKGKTGHDKSKKNFNGAKYFLNSKASLVLKC